MAAAPPPTRPIKILMLHGYTQSGPLFQAKTGALRKSLQKAFPAGIELVYPTAPIRLTPADESFLAGTGTSNDSNNENPGEKQEQELDAWAWWKKKQAGDSHTYSGIEQTFDFLATILKDSGPFDGAIGFSQGAAAAAMLASLLEPNRRLAFDQHHAQTGGHSMPFPPSFTDPPSSSSSNTATPPTPIHPPLKFAVSYSGFAPTDLAPYTPFYNPRIATPILHFLGSQDVVVDEQRSLALVRACERDADRYIVYHPGGHFLPSTQKACVSALVGFIKEVLGEEGKGEKGGEEEGVEGMDVPF
ncbi:hypothetical protein J1614_007668 [Plenodomus biglobosus]|nr:hypothetical protein J1614_007668 [Plenodomus biglobosus]